MNPQSGTPMIKQDAGSAGMTVKEIAVMNAYRKKFKKEFSDSDFKALITGGRQADLLTGMKDFKEGEIRYAQGIETSLKYGGMAYVAFDTQGVAFALAGQGRWGKAIRLDAAAREQFKKLGMVVDGMVGFWDEWIDTYIEGAKKEVGKELTFLYQQEGIKMGLERALEYALDFNLD